MYKWNRFLRKLCPKIFFVNQLITSIIHNKRKSIYKLVHKRKITKLPMQSSDS